MKNDIGFKIAIMLRQQKMRQKDLATQIGMTESAISKYIAGEVTPRADTLARIAAALHTSSDYLIGTETRDIVEVVRCKGCKHSRRVDGYFYYCERLCNAMPQLGPIQVVEMYDYCSYGVRKSDALQCAKEVPAADVVQVRCGRWEHTCTSADEHLECLKCSVCAFEDTEGYYFNYCPNCGAKMNGEESDGQRN